MPATKLDRNRKRDPLMELIGGRMAVLNMTKAEFAKRMGWSHSKVFSRFKDFNCWTLGEFKTAAHVLGVPITEMREKIT